jgi:hypothetical protein
MGRIGDPIASPVVRASIKKALEQAESLFSG